MATTTYFPKFDLSKLDLSKLELPKFDLPKVDTDALVGAVKDAAYITVGLAALALQKAQSARRDLIASLNDQFGSGKAQLDDVVESFEARVAAVDARIAAIEAKIDAAVESLEKRLPERAGALLGQAHGAAKAARKQVRELIKPAA